MKITTPPPYTKVPVSMDYGYGRTPWRHVERLPLDDVEISTASLNARTPLAAAPCAPRPSFHAYSWHGKKIRVLHGPGVGPALPAVTNQKQPVGDKGKQGDGRAKAESEAGNDGSGHPDAVKENASKTISKAWRKSKMARTRDMLGIGQSTDRTSCANRPLLSSVSAATAPVLLPSVEPTLPSASENERGKRLGKKKKKKKKKSLSFSMEDNQTHLFDRVEEGDVNSVWYSREEEMENRRAAREDNTPFERIGLADVGTQTANFGLGDAQLPYGASHGHEYRRRHAEWHAMSKTKGGRRTTTAVGWRKGAKYGKVVMENVLTFPADVYAQELAKKKIQRKMARAGGW